MRPERIALTEGSSRSRTVTTMFRLAICALFVLAAVACGGESEGQTELPQGSERVELDAAEFTTEIDNPYWPMAPGSRWVYREDGELKVVVTVTDRKKVVAGIDALVVHDVVTENGEVIEDTFDWYAQDAEGNVWYLGEETKEFEDGKVVSTSGSWEAGVDGAQAGIVVPADPQPGMKYRQEYYKGEAEDRAEVLSVDAKATVPFGSFSDVLQTKDTTPLEPDLVEHKYYAREIGPVLAVAVSNSGGREELISFRRGKVD
jgi:hypothetical protein